MHPISERTPKLKLGSYRQKPNKQPQTLLSFHGYVIPPHWRARRRQTIAPIRNVAPTRSISLIFCLKLMWLKSRFGLLKKPATVMIVRPPNGKLIQKHLQHHHISSLIHMVVMLSASVCRVEAVSLRLSVPKRPSLYASARLANRSKSTKFQPHNTNHLQVNWSVKTPPRIGPTIEATPNMELRQAR
jgi:hypothetical protein